MASCMHKAIGVYCSYCHWNKDSNLGENNHLPWGRWYWSGPAWSCTQPGGQKQLFAEKTVRNSAAMTNRIKSSWIWLEPIVHVFSVWRLYQLMEMWVTQMLQCAAEMSHLGSRTDLQHTQMRTYGRSHAYTHTPVSSPPSPSPVPRVLNMSTSLIVTEEQTDLNLNMQQIKWCRSLNIWATSNW